MKRVSSQQGFILLPVVIAIVLIASIAFMLNNQGSINVDEAAGMLQTEQAEQVARAGLAHVTWVAQNSACAGDMAITTVPFGQAGTGSYSAEVDSAATTTTRYRFTPDRDTYLKQGSSSSNYGNDPEIKVMQLAGNDIHGLYHYDLSSIPSNQKVVTATARFYVTTPDAQSVLTLHPVTADWTEADATWDTVGGRFDSGAYGTVLSQPVKDLWISVNVTALAQGWVNNPGSNYGFLLRAVSSDNLQSKYTSREYATASLRPYLEVTTADAAVSPVKIAATGTLTVNPSPANDITRSLTKTAVTAYQPAGPRVLQPAASRGKDTTIDGNKPSLNYGANPLLEVRSGPKKSALLHFDLSGIDSTARILSAQLELYAVLSTNFGVVNIHRLDNAWVEGTCSTPTCTADGATFNTRDGSVAWNTAGGDYQLTGVDSQSITALDQYYPFDITELVKNWVQGSVANNGVMIHPAAGTDLDFASSDDPDTTRHPRLTITYACECGSPCLAPQGTGTVGMVVINPSTLVPADADKKALFESWGYTVNAIGENTNAAGYLTAAASNDVFFISETVNTSQLGVRIKDVPIGVVSQDGTYNSSLGFATGNAWPVGPAINVTDTSHYITAVFAKGPLDIYAAGMEQLTVSGTEAPGLQTLADSGGAGSLVVLDKGADMAGGGSAAGRRVMLPLGREGKFNWDYLNANGRLIVQRALQWGTGNTGTTAPAKNLLFVAASTSPTAQEQLRIDLIESWGYVVNVIDDADSQANFDAAVAANDVAYVSSTVSDTTLNTKLRNASIGVVNENMLLAATFGFGNEYQTKSHDQIRVLGFHHFITEPLPVGYITIFNSLQTVFQRSSSTYEMDTLADSFNIGNDDNNKPSLLTINSGTVLQGGGTAAGRRVQLPWGSSTFDVAALNADGQGIMQRAIEWAEGSGASGSCSADYSATAIASEFSTASYPQRLNRGVTYFPEGQSLGGVVSPPGGAWIAVGGSGILWMVGMDGTELDGSYATGLSQLEGITFVPAANPADPGHLAIVKGSTLYYSDMSLPANASFTTHSLNSMTSAGGVSYIEGGTYDGNLAVADKSSGDLVIYKPDFSKNRTISSGGTLIAPEGIAHLKGTDKFLVIDTGQSAAVIIDADLTLHQKYDLMPFSLGAPTGAAAAIHPTSCDHFFGDRPNNRYVYLNAGGGGSPPPAAIAVTQDSYILGGSNSNYGTEPGLLVGRDNGGPVLYSLVQFDVSSVPPGTLISSATLRLYQYANRRNGSFDVGAHRIDRAWTETGVTWSNAGGSGNYSFPAVSTITVTQGDYRWYEWDVTPLVQEWVDNPPVSGNYGIELVYVNVTAGNNVSFASREHTDSSLHPQLLVNY